MLIEQIQNKYIEVYCYANRINTKQIQNKTLKFIVWYANRINTKQIQNKINTKHIEVYCMVC